MHLFCRFWQVLPCGQNKFETRSLGASFAVDLDKKECTCRMWQLNGYGCVHSVATISFMNRPMEGYVDPLLLGNFFINTYRYPILPMNGSDMWPSTEFTPPLPPPKRRMPGRPQVKRRRGEEEGRNNKVSRAGKQVVCGNCKQPGHNKATCTFIPPHPVKLNVKRKVTLEKGESSGVKQKKKQKGQGKNEKKRPSTNTGTRKAQKRKVLFEHGESSGVNRDGGEGGDEQAQAAALVESIHGIHLEPQAILVDDLHAILEAMEQVQPQGVAVDGVQPQGQVVDEVQPQGQVVDEVQPQGQVVDEVQPQGQVVDEVQPQGQVVDEVQPQGQVVEEVQPVAVPEVHPHPLGADQPHLQKKQVKRSDRIARKKLARRVSGKNGEGDTGATPMMIE